MFKTIGWPEMILFLVVIILVFGVGRISKIAGELGSGIRAFKEGLSEKKEKSSEFIEDDSEDNSED
jgi:sec-independent protein translocase protein TatA